MLFIHQKNKTRINFNILIRAADKFKMIV